MYVIHMNLCSSECILRSLSVYLILSFPNAIYKIIIYKKKFEAGMGVV